METQTKKKEISEKQWREQHTGSAEPANYQIKEIYAAYQDYCNSRKWE